MGGFDAGQSSGPKEAWDTPFAYLPAWTRSGAKTAKATCFEGSYILQKLQKLGKYAVVEVDRHMVVELQAPRTLK